MAAKRAAARDLLIPSVRNPRRRRRCGRDPALFARAYFPHLCPDPFTSTRRAIIDAFRRCLEHGGNHALAAPRGTGKTTLARVLIIWAILYALRRFAMLIGANAPKAAEHTDAIAHEFETNPALGDDFPAICVPIRALAGANQRASAQTVSGRRTHLHWSGERRVLPTIPGEPASGSVLCCLGMESAIRGANYRGIRPDIVLLDDPETAATATSPTEVARNTRTLEADIMGLAGPDRRIACLYVCTVEAAGCMADAYTDPARKPAWSGVRHKLIEQWPSDTAAWDRYMDQRVRDQQAGDPDGRTAHAMYLADRRTMDAGAVVTDPHRYYSDVLPDGTRQQASTIQFAYDYICDYTPEAFASEYQNEPPSAAAPDAVDLTPAIVLSRCSGRPRGHVPPSADHLTMGVDIGGRAVHWSLVAFAAGVAHVVDYGGIHVRSPLTGTLDDDAHRAAIADAIRAALGELHDLASAGWADDDPAATGPRRPDCACIDVGWARGGFDVPIFEFCREAGLKTWRPLRGFGSRRDQESYRAPARAGRGRKVYTHAYTTWQPRHKCRLVKSDADYWKLYVHAALLAPAAEPGSMTLFGSDPAVHRVFARHLTAERWENTWDPRRGEVFAWNQLRRDNHWLDATAYACCAAGLLGLPTAGVDRRRLSSAVASGDAAAAPAAPSDTSAAEPAAAPAAAPAPKPKPKPKPKPAPVVARRVRRVRRRGR